MYTTYYIENSIGDLLDYYQTLSSAKEELKKLIPNEHRIVQLKGPEKFQGYHMYYVYFDGKKFIKQKLR